MYRAALRSTSRATLGAPPRAFVRAAPRRFASTQSPADKPRSWKSSALRWGLAVAAVYYYSTGSVFADETPEARALIPAPSPFAESDLPTVDAVIEEKRKQARPDPAGKTPDSNQTAASQPQSEAQTSTAVPGSPEALEEEAGQEGAFNPETGEINWDCPCLGGMAHGPCGEEFKSAFSCFVYSTEEPKGMDCIEKFQGMQECFRKYPDIYGAELADDEQSEEIDDGAKQPLASETPAPRGEQRPTQPHETETQVLRENVAAIKPETPSAKSTESSAPVAKSEEKKAPKESSPSKATK
ncbi:CHCH domain-containing protein [Hirsutella rhossiliensis]|uniref:Mitochondrial intermembrane space import and assembly protein 40 n=1 Tax=Hirsutella rhossiliensis TaxID=111463 RepID=A0A9P8N4X1_9HYPO|nr:CHCH domain-containing protein [Hirsutella rhossiliensis]KAH0967678.1 CHCH domain-containing protein [Hirsutella rhossiliensis]